MFLAHDFQLHSWSSVRTDSTWHVHPVLAAADASLTLLLILMCRMATTMQWGLVPRPMALSCLARYTAGTTVHVMLTQIVQDLVECAA